MIGCDIMDRKIAVIDGNSLMYRAFYALPLLNNADGVYTNAVLGFLTMALKVINDYSPTHIAVGFDMHGPTFRHEKFDQYKAGRRETPIELVPQFDLLRQVLEAMGIKYYQLSPYEADDILGTIAKKCAEDQDEVILITGDRDSFQLIDDNVKVLFTKRGISDVDLLGREELKEKYGVYPERVTHLKALMGDNSDNIPGIPGIGEKTALKLLDQFGSLDEIFANTDQLKGKQREKVETGKESALMSRELATIVCNVPIDFVVDDCKIGDFSGAKPIFEKLGFRSLMSKLGLNGASAKESKGFKAKERKTVTVNADNAEELVIKASKADLSALYMKEGLVEIAFEDTVLRFEERVSLLDEGFDYDTLMDTIRPYLESNGKKAVYDIKSIRNQLAKKGISLNGEFDDVMLLAYLLDGQIDKLDINGAGMVYDSLLYYKAQIKGTEIEKLYNDIEHPLADVLFDMEQTGFTIDKSELRSIGDELKKKMTDMEQVIYLLAGHSFNILSPKQLGTVLFEELGLPASKKTKTGYSTDASVLEGLIGQHDIIEAIIEYRATSKLYGTYIDGLIDKADNSGRIHTTFYQTGAATGRLSSADPNLQNIPVRTEQGRIIRKAFIPLEEDHVLVAADYSQIELRVLAHMSNDVNFIKAFLDGADIHAYTASEVFSVPLEMVTSEMRSNAKAVNFGIVYGISEFGLARNIKVTRKEAAGYIQRFFERYPDVKAFMDRCIADGKSQGYVETMFGRRRYIPEISSGNYNTRSFGERIAMNTPIQGTAADIIKLAMVNVSKALKESGLGAKLILQVHDELIIDSPKEHAQEVGRILQENMQKVVSLNVPLIAEVKIAKNWLDAK